MTFHFRFETVLSVKTRHEEEKRHRLAAEERRLSIKTQQLQGIEKTVQAGVTDFIDKCSGALDMDYLVNSRTYLAYLKECKNTCKVEMETVRQDVNRARHELVEARKECKAMEQLKEKDRQQYKREVLAKEQNFLDEIGISAHRRKRR